MLEESRIQPIDHRFLERIEPDALPLLPGEDFSAAYRVDAHAVLPLAAELGEPFPDVFKLRGHSWSCNFVVLVQRVFLRRVKVLTLGVTIPRRARSIELVVGEQQQGCD